MPPVNMPQYGLSFAQEHAQKLKDMGVISEDTANQLAGFPGPQHMQALVNVESGGNPDAVSPKGAQGVAQLMPETAAEVAQSIGLDPKSVNLLDPAINQRLGAIYLKQQAEKFGSAALGYAAYNAGPGRVAQAVKAAGSNDINAVLEHLPQETQDYLPKIEAAGGLPRGTVSQTSQQVRQTGPDLEQMDQGYQTQKAAMLEKMLAEEKAGAEINRVRKAEQTRAELDYEDELKRQQAQRDQLAKSTAIYSAALEDAAKATVDPDRYYKNQSTADKVLAGIAIALSGVAAGLQGRGGNMALELINQAIDRDIEAQKVSLAQKNKSAEAKSTAYALLRQQYGDERQATETLRSIMLERAKNQIASIAEGASRQEQKAEANKLFGQLQVQQQEAKQKIDEYTKQQPAYLGEQANKLIAGKTRLQDVPEKLRELVIPGLGIATDAASKKTAAEAFSNFKGVDSGLSTLIQMREENTFSTSPKRWAQMKAISTDVKLQIKEMAKLGAISGTDAEMLSSLVPDDPAEWKILALPGVNQDPILSTLNTTRDRFRQKFSQGMDQYMMDFFPEGKKVIMGATPFNPQPR